MPNPHQGLKPVWSNLDHSRTRPTQHPRCSGRAGSPCSRGCACVARFLDPQRDICGLEAGRPIPIAPGSETPLAAALSMTASLA